jgi:sporulation protein YlmC with PRC-barrel domain
MKKFLTILALAFALAFLPAAAYSKTPAVQDSDRETNVSDSATQNAGRDLKIPASEIIGKGVQNQQGEYLGIVRDLIIDKQNGGISFALLSPGGVLGIPMRYVPVPFGAMTFDEAKNVYFMDMSRQKILAAPGFDRGGIPQQASRGWEVEVFRYYGQTPAWGESDRAAAGGPAYRFNEMRGMDVRDAQGKKLGSIRDLVIDSRGHVPEAVVAHGGFLGIATKLAAVSLKDLKFDPQNQSFILSWTKEELNRAPEFQEGKLGTRS